MDFPSLWISHKISVEEGRETSLGTLRNAVIFLKTLNQNLHESTEHVVNDDMAHGTRRER